MLETSPLRTVGLVLLLIGLLFGALGLTLLLTGRLPGLGRLPGDIFIQRERWSLHLPLMTCIVLSLLLTLLLNLLLRR